MNISPRFFNIILISLVLGMLYWMSVQNNTAQEGAGSQQAADGGKETVTALLEADGSEESISPVFPEVQQDGDTPTLDEATAPERGAEETLEAEAEEEVKANFQGLLTISVLIILLLGCSWLGNVIAKKCRLPDHGFKIFVVLLAFFGGFAAIAPVGLGWKKLTLGIDLQGGVVLIYDAKPMQGSEAKGINMEELTRAISRRINPGGVKEIAITKLGVGQVQIIIPHAEAAEVARIERVVSESGALTFRILASRAFIDDPKEADIIRRGEAAGAGREIFDSTGKVLARWVPIFDSERSSFNNPDMVLRERGKKLEALVKFDDGVDIHGEHLTTVGRGMGREGSPGVSFNFNAIGANKFGRLTSANRPSETQARQERFLGIVLNDSLYSAPRIRTTIRESGIIEFASRNTEAERKKLNQDIDDLIGVLHAGALPAELEGPVGKMQIGATLGKDTIEKATYALIFSTVFTIGFMLFYYRLAGFIAAFCVITNTVLVVAIMLSLRAAFTLPGLAGLVLTIGMAIDANILIYERIREELRGGASLKMAIRNGYAKAFSAIFDSNSTTIVIGCILYVVGTEQIKGFAVTLVLGVALNLFTAIYCARVIMDVLATQRWVKTFKMMQLFPRPNINFLQTRVACMVVSTVLILIGLAATFIRGRELLDIDFVGGVSVEVVFKDTQSIVQIRERLKMLNDLAVQDIQAGKDDEDQQLKANSRFIITTSTPQEKDAAGNEIQPDAYLLTVRNFLKDTFGNELEYLRLDYEVGTTKQLADFDEVTVQVTRYPKTNRDALASEIGTKIKDAAAKGLIDVEFSHPSIADITRVGSKEEDLGPQNSYEDWTVTFHAPKNDLETVLAFWQTELNGTPNFPTSTTVGGSVARYMRIQGMAAIIASLIFLAIYMTVRFTRWQYGIVAVLGLIHVVLLVLGSLALSEWIAKVPLLGPGLMVNEFKIGLPVLAAFLALIAYAIHDTIILFDRIRENLGKSAVLTGTMINTAINQTLSRTVLTSATTFLVALILYVFGGQGIHVFSFAIAAGVFFGTYSTIFICAPLLFWMVGKNDLNPNETMTLEKM